MRKQIAVAVRRLEMTLLDVDFPIYRKHEIEFDGGGLHVWLTRIDETGMAMTLEKTSLHEKATVEYRLEFKQANFQDGSSLDYQLGRGQYASSQAEYREALGEFCANINRVVFATDSTVNVFKTNVELSLPTHLQAHVDQWIASNKLTPSYVRYGAFPIGFVSRLIDTVYHPEGPHR